MKDVRRVILTKITKQYNGNKMFFFFEDPQKKKTIHNLQPNPTSFVPFKVIAKFKYINAQLT